MPGHRPANECRGRGVERESDGKHQGVLSATESVHHFGLHFEDGRKIYGAAGTKSNTTPESY